MITVSYLHWLLPWAHQYLWFVGALWNLEDEQQWLIGEVIELRLLGCYRGMSLLVLTSHSEAPGQDVLILTLPPSQTVFSSEGGHFLASWIQTTFATWSSQWGRIRLTRSQFRAWPSGSLYFFLPFWIEEERSFSKIRRVSQPSLPSHELRRERTAEDFKTPNWPVAELGCMMGPRVTCTIVNDHCSQPHELGIWGYNV